MNINGADVVTRLSALDWAIIGHEVKQNQPLEGVKMDKIRNIYSKRSEEINQKYYGPNFWKLR